MEWRDLFGKEIRIGDAIVYSATDGRCGVLRAGVVVELTTRKEIPTAPVIKVKAAEWRWHKEKPEAQSKVITLGYLDRVVVLHDIDALPKEWQDEIWKVPNEKKWSKTDA